MSWLSDLAGKAETLLNKIDQNAAAVLQEKDKGHGQNSPNEPERTESRVHVSESSPDFDKTVQSKLLDKKKSLRDVNRSPARKKFNGSMKHSSSFSGSLSDASKLQNSSPLKSFTLGDDSNNEEETQSPSETLKEINESQQRNEEHEENEELDNFDMENAMLKNEISVVHNELSLLLSKTKNAEKVTQDTQYRFAQMETMYDRVLKENEKLHTKVSDYENRISNSFDNDEENDWKMEKKSLEQRIKNLESTINSLTSVKKDLEADLTSSRNMCLDLEDKLEKTKTEAANSLTEWKNYKIRVSNTLAAKEKLIETLGGKDNLSETETIPILNKQMQQLKDERDESVEELTLFKSEFENKCKEIDQIELNLRTTERQVSQLKESLRQEKSARELAEHTVETLNKELQTVHSETAQQISSLRTMLRENKPSAVADKHTSEINNSFGVSESGEDRFRSLTQSLVAKQAALESITADRNALRLQLEKTENKYRSDLVSMRNNQPRIINFNYTDDVKEQFPSLLRESPWDSRLSRKVKKAYSSLDSFSVRIGIFLRRNPIARIFIIAYMIILHLWVLIVLCTYTPEAHPRNIGAIQSDNA